MTASIYFVFDTRSQKKDETHPVKLAVYYQGTKKLYNSGFSFTQSQWEKLKGGKLRDEFLKRKKAALFEAKSHAEKVIEKISPFSFELFEKRFKNSSYGIKGLEVYQLFEQKIAELKAEDRIGSAIAYDTAKKSLQSYKKTLSFIEVTSSFLKNYERAQLNQSLSSTTIGIYLRQLRAIYYSN